MKDIENKIKDRLSNAQSNEGIDANDLWNNISEEMGLPASDDKVIPASKFNFKKFWPLLALLFLAVIGFYFYQNNSSSSTDNPIQATTPNTAISTNKQSNKTQDQKTQHAASAESNPAKAAPEQPADASGTLSPTKALNATKTNATSTFSKTDEESAPITTPTTHVKKPASAASKSGNRPDVVADAAQTKQPASVAQLEKALAERSSATPQRSAPLDESSSNDESTKADQAKSSASGQQLTTSEMQQPMNGIAKATRQQAQQNISESSLADQQASPPTAGEAATNVSTASSTAEASAVKRMALLEALASKPPGLVLSQQKKEEEEFKLLEKLLDRKNAHFSLGLFAGSHVLKNTFSASGRAATERANLLNGAYKVKLGQQLALEVNFHLNKKLYFSTGVAYQRSNSQFNLVQTWDTTMVHPNVSTGELIAARAIRTIRHRNQLSNLVLPLSLGYQRELGRWGIGAQAGLAFNFLQSQSGKAMNANNQISIYPDDEHPAVPVAKTFLSYHLRPYIYFRSSQKLSWQLRTDFGYQQYGQSDYYGLKHGAFLSGVNIGVVFKP